MADDVIEALKASELFRGVSEKHLARIRDAGKELEFAVGEELTEEGTVGGRFFLILDGTAEVTVHGAPRRTLSRGDGVGEVALLDEGPRSATVTATTPVRTFALASWNFRPLIGEPEIAQAVVALLCRRLREAEAPRAV